MSEKSELEERIAAAEEVLRELKQLEEQERVRRQHAEIDRLEEHLARARISLADLRPAAGAAWAELRQAIDALIASLHKLLNDHTRDD